MHVRLGKLRGWIIYTAQVKSVWSYVYHLAAIVDAGLFLVIEEQALIP